MSKSPMSVDLISVALALPQCRGLHANQARDPEPPAGGVPSVAGARNRPVMRRLFCFVFFTNVTFLFFHLFPITFINNFIYFLYNDEYNIHHLSLNIFQYLIYTHYCTLVL
jgi:hypothetical protein